MIYVNITLALFEERQLLSLQYRSSGGVESTLDQRYN